MKWLNNSLLCALLLGVVDIQAYVYEACALKKPNHTNDNKTQYILGLSDFHDKVHTANIPQRSHIEDRLNDLPREKIKVIVEDLSSSSRSGQPVCDRFSLTPRSGILSGLASKCRELGIEVENVEYRYCRVIALGPALTHGKNALDQLPSTNYVKVSGLIEEIKTAVDYIKTFDDGPEFNAIYKRELDKVEEALRILKLEKYTNYTVADLLASSPDASERQSYIKQLLTFDSWLLDLNMLHAIAQSKDKEMIILIAGGSHINRTCEILKQAGYISIEHSNVSNKREYDLSRCLGAQMVGDTFCIKPQAISTKLIDQLFQAGQ